MNTIEIIIFHSFWILGLINTFFSFMASIILSSNGYKVSFLVTQFHYEIRSLWELSKTKKSIRKLALLYTILFILFGIDLIINIILFITHLP
jgi:hypothetical protein